MVHALVIGKGLNKKIVVTFYHAEN